MSFEPILLAPEDQVEVLYPYRRVWRTSWIEALLLMGVVAAIWIAARVLSAMPDTEADLPRVAVASLPLLLWMAISYRAERRAPQRRRQMLAVVVLGALAANGVAVPLEDRVFEPDLWLPLAGFFGRVLGYMFTQGITTAFLFYIVLRYSVWPDRFVRRQDGIAYALALAVGYATVFSVRSALYTDATLVPVALRVASITFSHLALGALIGFFMAELVIGRVPIFWMAFGLGFVAFLDGLFYAFRAVAIVGGLSVAGTGSSPVRGLMLAFGFVAVTYTIVAFIVESADTRERLASGRREVL